MRNLKQNDKPKFEDVAIPSMCRGDTKCTMHELSAATHRLDKPEFEDVTLPSACRNETVRTEHELSAATRRLDKPEFVFVDNSIFACYDFFDN